MSLRTATVYVRVAVGGTFGQFNVVYLLVMLTTSIALLSGVTFVVDFLAMHVLDKRAEYREAKYDEVVIEH